jgi:hypothetical protein
MNGRRRSLRREYCRIFRAIPTSSSSLGRQRRSRCYQNFLGRQNALANSQLNRQPTTGTRAVRRTVRISNKVGQRWLRAGSNCQPASYEGDIAGFGRVRFRSIISNKTKISVNLGLRVGEGKFGLFRGTVTHRANYHALQICCRLAPASLITTAIDSQM